MKPLQALVQRFDGLAKRERVMVFFAVASVILGAAFALAMDPALTRSKELAARIADHKVQLAALGRTQQELTGQLALDIDAQAKGQLAQANAHLTDLDHQIKNLHRTLIPAQSMAKVMGDLLDQETGVRLISLRNMAAEPLTLDGPEGSATESAKSKTGSGLLYKHGVELIVEGGYFELLSYLSRLEKQSWRMLWSETSLSAEYPKARLRMKLYTLSLDSSWLSV